jgi:asparagine synthase (glutamine-hydrolysing)
MCGIYGSLDLRARGPMMSPDGALDLLRHRGPDDRGAWAGDGIFVGTRRLSIIDLPGGAQPIWNEDHTMCIVYNGELYNFEDLRPELIAKGHRFRSRGDTEVVLHAYEQWGPSCLRRFNGMFAFAIWDGKNRTLFLARDRIGEKPLYYFQDEDRIVFASEIKAILADRSVHRQLNLGGLANFLAYGHAVAPQTIYERIFKLPPGHYLLVKDGCVQVKEYWDVGDEPQVPSGAELTQDTSADLIRELLSDSVRRRMIADVPVGAFLSGGVDSSAVVALMKRHATGPVKTFSVGFTIGGGYYSELSDAREAAKYLGTEHYELIADHVDLLDTLHTLVYHYDEPFADPAGFPLYLLSGFAREHVKVVLTGDGGDELFGGYRRYAVDGMAPLYQRLPQGVTDRWLPSLVQRLPRLRRIKRAVDTLPIAQPASRYAAWLYTFTPEMQAELMNPDIHAGVKMHDLEGPYRHYYDHLNGGPQPDHLNRLMYIDVKTWLADAYMEKLDKASMAQSIEARVPLLDHRLVELAFQIPSRYKIRGLSTKRIFKQAVQGLVPSRALRKPKHGFNVPTDPWFRGDLRSFAFEVLLDGQARNRGYFNVEFIERLWREHMTGRHLWDGHLWLLMNFELWHQAYLDVGTGS